MDTRAADTVLTWFMQIPNPVGPLGQQRITIIVVAALLHGEHRGSFSLNRCHSQQALLAFLSINVKHSLIGCVGDCDITAHHFFCLLFWGAAASIFLEKQQGHFNAATFIN